MNDTDEHLNPQFFFYFDSKNYIDMIDNITRLRRTFLIKKKENKLKKKRLRHIVLVNVAVWRRDE